MGLNALDVILDLTANTSLSDAHLEYIFEESFKLLIAREWAINATFILHCQLLSTLRYEYVFAINGC